MASQRFQGLVFGDDYAEINAGDGCYMGGYRNDQIAFRVWIHAIVLQNDTIAYFEFVTYPPRDGSLNRPVPAPSAQVTEAMETVINAQVDKIRQGT